MLYALIYTVLAYVLATVLLGNQFTWSHILPQSVGDLPVTLILHTSHVKVGAGISLAIARRKLLG